MAEAATAFVIKAVTAFLTRKAQQAVGGAIRSDDDAPSTWQTIAGAAIQFGINRFLRRDNAISTNEMASRMDVGVTPLAPREIVYGLVRKGGPVVYANVTGSPPDYEHIIIVLAGHEIQSIDKIFIDGTETTLTSSGSDSNGITRYVVNSGDYSGQYRIKYHLGTDSQAADADLVSDTSGTGDWTTAHTLSGIAYVYIRRAIDSEVFPGGSPRYSFELKGAKLYDPRTSTTAYSDNSALALGHYLALQRERGGVGSATSEINDTAWQAAANKCEESVTISGGSEERYTTNGVIITSDSPADNIGKLTGAMAGWVDRINGEWYMEAGQYNTPAGTITESELRGPLRVATNYPIRSQFNAVKGVYVDLDQEGQPVDFPRVVSRDIQTVTGVDTGTDVITLTGHGLSDGDRIDFTTSNTLPGGISEGVFYYVITSTANTFKIATTLGGSAVNITTTGTGTHKVRYDQYLTQDGDRLTHDIALPMTSSRWRAQRLAAIELSKIRQGITVQARCNLSAWKYQPGDTVRVLSERYGWYFEESSREVSGVISFTDIIIVYTAGLSDGDAVTISTTGTLPGGLESDTLYFISIVTTNQIKLGRIITGEDGSGNKTVGQIVDITTAGSDTHTLHIEQGKLFCIESASLVTDGLSPGVDMTLRETASTLYDWDYNNA